MAQINNGIRQIFNHPVIYDFFQNLVGAKKQRKMYVKNYLQIFDKAKVLDIGCGTSEILDYLPENIDYVGFDLSENYIESARRKYKNRGKWFCKSVMEMSYKENGTFDIVMANGVFHHLDNHEALNLSKFASIALKDSGKFCSFDGCYVNDQNPIARFLLSKDRGLNIRNKEQYESLVSPYFENIDLNIRHDLLNVPYTHAIIVATKPKTNDTL